MRAKNEEVEEHSSFKSYIKKIKESREEEDDLQNEVYRLEKKLEGKKRRQGEGVKMWAGSGKIEMTGEIGMMKQTHGTKKGNMNIVNIIMNLGKKEALLARPQATESGLRFQEKKLIKWWYPIGRRYMN